MPGVDRVRRHRTGAARNSRVAATRTRATETQPSRFTMTSVAGAPKPTCALATHGIHAHSDALVLVISEDAKLRRSLCQTLAAQGYRPVDAASSRTDNVVEKIRPMLTILDLDRADGAGLASLVRARDASRETPVIALSAHIDEGDKVTALDVGADDYITKPIATSELLARIRVALRHMRRRAAAGEVVEVGRSGSIMRVTKSPSTANSSISRRLNSSSSRYSRSTPAGCCRATSSCTRCGDPTPSRCTICASTSPRSARRSRRIPHARAG